MALALDATVGGTASNSYSTAAQGDIYHESRLFSTDWSGATLANQEAALAWATRMLDYNFEWTGSKYTIEQALRWPRFGALDRDGQLFDSNVIPIEVKNATAELARLLLSEDRGLDAGTKGIKRLKVDVIELEFDKLDRSISIPDEVFQMLSHLGRLVKVAASGGHVSMVPLVRT